MIPEEPFFRLGMVEGTEVRITIQVGSKLNTRTCTQSLTKGVFYG